MKRKLIKFREQAFLASGKGQKGEYVDSASEGEEKNWTEETIHILMINSHIYNLPFQV